ncbi:MAG TPA: hypothetical protein VN026_18815 [Bacteroidia bacterium]|jgi:hypothetical protein|nr:hypothetical protein [Bacteroidia bacterium]
MTYYDANKIFTGVTCPYCKDMTVVNFDSNNLFTHFMGFIPGENNTKECCAKLRKQLNTHILLYLNGATNERAITEEMLRYKLCA